MKIGKRRTSTGEVPASALSDIAFLLIIFFIIVAVFSPRIGISVSIRNDSKKAASSLKKGEVITLEGRNRNTVIYRNKQRSMIWIKSFLMQAANQNPEVAVKIRLKPTFRYGNLVRIAAFVNHAGIKKFRVVGEVVK